MVIVVHSNKLKIFLDMDNVLVDFDGSTDIPLEEKHLYNHSSIYKPGFFSRLSPMPGAMNFVERLLDSDKYDVHILTQPVSASPISYYEKAAWIAQFFPELSNKITMTQDKTLIHGGILIDDSPKWASFNGEFILFDYKKPKSEFVRILNHLRSK